MESLKEWIMDCFLFGIAFNVFLTLIVAFTNYFWLTITGVGTLQTFQDFVLNNFRQIFYIFLYTLFLFFVVFILMSVFMKILNFIELKVHYCNNIKGIYLLYKYTKFLGYLLLITALIIFIPTIYLLLIIKLDVSFNFLLLFPMCIIAGILIAISNSLMSHRDMVKYFLMEFRKAKTKSSMVLTKALLSYNEALGSSFSIKKLHTISQYVNAAYMFGEEENIKELNEKIDGLIKAVENEDHREATEILLKLAEYSEQFIQKYENKLGYEVKIPLEMRGMEAIKSVLEKSLPQLIVFLCLIGISLLISLLGIEMPFPLKYG